MEYEPLGDADIIESWTKNAPFWTAAVRSGRIESRRQVTDRAILDVILKYSPRSVLDVGCGEGWLARRLSATAIHVLGIDAVPEFIEEARRAGGGDFRVLSYEALAAGELQATVDALVCNFSLLGEKSVEGVFGVAPSLLNPRGVFIVQTVHPLAVCGDRPCRDGWREETWAGFGPGFTDPAPWYFRTLASWENLFAAGGFSLLEIRQPLHPRTRQPASLMFVAMCDRPV